MSSKSGLVSLVLLTGAMLLPGTGGASALAGYITFDQRQNVNLLSSPEVTITASHFMSENNDSGNQLRGGFQGDISSSGVGWFSGNLPAEEKVVFTIDLGRVRNVETFRLNGPRNITSATIESSSDGISWTPLTHSTTVSGSDSLFVLDAPEDTQWLRLTGETYAFGQPSVGLNHMRVYGAAGTLKGDSGLDLVSSSGWTAGNATITQSGGSVTPATALTDMADDNPATLTRQLIFDVSTGDSVTVTFDQLVQDIYRVGFAIGRSGSTFDPDMHIQFLGSTDGVNFDTVLVDQVGGIVIGPNWFDFAKPVDAIAVRLLIVSVVGTDHRINDIFVYQVPEPASAVVMLVGGALSLSLKRPRRKAGANT